MAVIHEDSRGHLIDSGPFARIQLEGRKDEFRELADAFDAMLARLDAHVAEQQRFAANASHELRTPLAITQTLLDVARNDLNRDSGELVDRLRADQRSFTPEHVDLSLIGEEATERSFGGNPAPAILSALAGVVSPRNQPTG